MGAGELFSRPGSRWIATSRAEVLESEMLERDGKKWGNKLTGTSRSFLKSLPNDSRVWLFVVPDALGGIVVSYVPGAAPFSVEQCVGAGHDRYLRSVFDSLGISGEEQMVEALDEAAKGGESRLMTQLAAYHLAQGSDPLEAQRKQWLSADPLERNANDVAFMPADIASKVITGTLHIELRVTDTQNPDGLFFVAYGHDLGVATLSPIFFKTYLELNFATIRGADVDVLLVRALDGRPKWREVVSNLGTISGSVIVAAGDQPVKLVMNGESLLTARVQVAP